MPRKNIPTDVFKSINIGAKDECWSWKGRYNKKDSRPYFTSNGRQRPAYVWVLELHTGEEASKRLALHSCDNGESPVGCCNPHHLRWGTHDENMKDMVDRERHGLPAIVVKAIRKLRSEGKTQKEVAELYGISREAVSAIDTGRRK
jgi:hypothetical protein